MWCVPYADSNAHGSIGNCMTFQRRGKSVRLIKKPFSKKDPSPLQDAVRYLWKQAVQFFHALEQAQRDCLDYNWSLHGYSGLSAFVQKVMVEELPEWSSLVTGGIYDLWLHDDSGMTNFDSTLYFEAMPLGGGEYEKIAEYDFDKKVLNTKGQSPYFLQNIKMKFSTQNNKGGRRSFRLGYYAFDDFHRAGVCYDLPRGEYWIEANDPHYLSKDGTIWRQGINFTWITLYNHYITFPIR